MDKGERVELRRILRSKFKLLQSDVTARAEELEAELEAQIKAHFMERDKAYDDAMFRLGLIADDANRQANDIGRELYGAETWGVKTDRVMVSMQPLGRPGDKERMVMRREGRQAIAVRVSAAVLELGRQENVLLTELATSALESAEARAFFARIPSVSELVPAYRLKEITQ